MQRHKFIVVGVILCILGVAGCEDTPTTSPAIDQSLDQLSTEQDPSLSKISSYPGFVYTLSNEAAGNSIIRYARSRDGSLTPAGNFPTGGTGSGAGLGNQGGLILENHLLYAVNAGSDEISVMREDGNQLTVVSKISSGGSMPISVAVHRNLLYVLNAGGSGNIMGFRGARSGILTPLPGSTRPLSSNAAGPAQVGFSPDGRILVVTEKATNQIDTYTVGRDGIASGPNVQSSTGETPFGFAFTRRGQLVVSDAFGGAAGLSALSSYRVNHHGLISLITGPVNNGQAAACWVAITKNGKFAYTTNTATANISGYGIDHRGRLSLLDPDGITASSDAGPIDMALSRNSQFLYTLNAGGQSITIYRVNNGRGNLKPLGSITGLPASANGLAAE